MTLEVENTILSVLTKCLNLAGQNSSVKALNNITLFLLTHYRIRTLVFICCSFLLGFDCLIFFFFSYKVPTILGQAK